MTTKDVELIADAFAQTEVILEESIGDEAGLGLSTLRICQDRVSAAISKKHPRFNAGRFEVLCFPISNARIKAALATLSKP